MGLGSQLTTLWRVCRGVLQVSLWTTVTVLTDTLLNPVSAAEYNHVTCHYTELTNFNH